MRIPQGFGVYSRMLGGRSYGTPLQMARRCQQHGVRWVALFAAWQDGGGLRSPSLAMHQRYARVLTAAGVDVWLWGYPRAGGEADFLARMQRYSAGLDIKGWLLDPEAGYKWGLRFLRRESTARMGAMQLVAGARAHSPGGVGVTSYGWLRGHPSFPWEEFADGTDFGSPQTYTLSDSRIATAMGDWRQYFPIVIPSTTAYGPRSGDLPAYLDAHGPVPGVCVWSWPQLSPPEWAVYAARKF